MTPNPEWENYAPVDPDEAFQTLWDAHEQAMVRIRVLEASLRLLYNHACPDDVPIDPEEKQARQVLQGVLPNGC